VPGASSRLFESRLKQGGCSTERARGQSPRTALTQDLIRLHLPVSNLCGLEPPPKECRGVSRCCRCCWCCYCRCCCGCCAVVGVVVVLSWCPLPDLGPVLLPPGFCCLPVICLGPQKFPFGGGPKFSAKCGARGMFRLNESTATTREAWVCCLLIRARTDATLRCVVVARLQQL
jgi:hypothetical protein